MAFLLIIPGSMSRFVLFLLFSIVLFADTHAQESFPARWVGDWRGTLNWYRQGRQTPEAVEMRLLIQPVPDSMGVYQWTLVYGKSSEDRRPYILRLIDSSRGHWAIDERNGIWIDQYLFGPVLSGAFSVGKSVITYTYRLEGDSLQVEYLSLLKEPVRQSGAGTTEIPQVDSYKILSYQKATLRRNRSD